MSPTFFKTVWSELATSTIHKNLFVNSKFTATRKCDSTLNEYHLLIVLNSKQKIFSNKITIQNLKYICVKLI